MNWSKIKNPFIVGGLFGVVLLFLQDIAHWLVVLTNAATEYVVYIFFLPRLMLNGADFVADVMCKWFHSNACRGMGFDGGPLVPLEWAAAIIGAFVEFGLLFWLISKLRNVLMKRKLDK